MVGIGWRFRRALTMRRPLAARLMIVSGVALVSVLALALLDPADGGPGPLRMMMFLLLVLGGAALAASAFLSHPRRLRAVAWTLPSLVLWVTLVGSWIAMANGVSPTNLFYPSSGGLVWGLIIIALFGLWWPLHRPRVAPVASYGLFAGAAAFVIPAVALVLDLIGWSRAPALGILFLGTDLATFVALAALLVGVVVHAATMHGRHIGWRPAVGLLLVGSLVLSVVSMGVAGGGVGTVAALFLFLEVAALRGLLGAGTRRDTVPASPGTPGAVAHDEILPEA